MPLKSTRSAATSSRRNTKPSISIVGPGRLGSSLAVALHRAGFQIDEIVTRNAGQARGLARRVGAKAITSHRAALDSDVVWLTVSDTAIGGVAQELAALRDKWNGQIVFHSSGALTSDKLVAVKGRGAAIASVHPLMTFSGGEPPLLRGVFFAIEGDARAVRAAKVLVDALGGVSMTVQAKHKAAYHAWATFGSPMLIALLAAAEHVADLAGLNSRDARRALLPLIRQTLDNYSAQGAKAAFTGPLIRGDVGTVAKHLQVLRKSRAVGEAYLALARVALESLPVGNKQEITRVLKAQRSDARR